MKRAATLACGWLLVVSILVMPVGAKAEPELLCVRFAADCHTHIFGRVGGALNLIDPNNTPDEPPADHPGPLVYSRDDSSGRYAFALTLGLSADFAPYGVGVAGLLGFARDGYYGAELVLRYWLNERSALELAPGFFENLGSSGTAPTIRIGYYRDWYGFGVRYSRIQFANVYNGYDASREITVTYPDLHRNEVSLEAQIAGTPGLIAMGVAAVTTVVLVIAFASSRIE